MRSWKKVTESYAQFFAIEEIAQSVRLKCVFAVSWFLCFFDLLGVSQIPPGRRGELNCWVYWGRCSEVYSFDVLPKSYNYGLWMTCIFALLLATAWCVSKKKWKQAHFFLSVVIIWKIIFSFVLVNAHTTNFDLFHLVPSVVLLFTRDKLRGLKYTWALMYLFAARVKLDESWILGAYFSSLQLGLPLFSRFLIPIVTNGVIVFEIICSVGLISKNKMLRKFSFWSWTVFHIYSATIVGFYYPVRCIGFVWSIFGFTDLDSTVFARVKKNSFALRTILISLLLIAMNVLPSMVFNDMNSTFEGLDYGFFMINSNYQCQHKIRVINAEGQITNKWQVSTSSPFYRCYPHDVFQEIQHSCKSLHPTEHILWTFWESRNGSPFHELINEQDACHLDYKPFSHNEWIHETKDSKVVGYPEKNMMAGKTTKKGPVIHESPSEESGLVAGEVIDGENGFMQRNYFYFKSFYMILWAGRLIFMIYLLFFGARYLESDERAR